MKKMFLIITIILIVGGLLAIRGARKHKSLVPVTQPTNTATNPELSAQDEKTPIVSSPNSTVKKAYVPGNYSESLKTPDGRTRTYLLHIPQGYSTSSSYPLILSFHGTFGQGIDQEKLSKFSAIADKEGFIVVYPDGLYREWNDGRGSSRPEKEGVDDVEFVSLLIDRLTTDLVINSKRIYANGMSNGSGFAHRLACDLSDKVSGIGAIATAMAEDLSKKCNPTRAIPVMMFHGTTDPFNPYGGGESNKGGRLLGAEEAALFWAKKNDCNTNQMVENLPDKVSDGTTVTKISYTGCQDNADIVLYKINGGGHIWPGGAQYLPIRIIGKTTYDVNASDAIWKFFKRHLIK